MDRDATLALLKSHLHKAQQVMKNRVDKHRQDVSFEVGDLVFLKLCLYRQKSLAKKSNEKLFAHFYGPYAVAARVGKVAYRLALPPEARIHPTFHVSQLKKAMGDLGPALSIPPQLTDEGVVMAEPEEIWGIRTHPISKQ